MQLRFFDLLEKENRKGATILFSSHILSEVQRLCDRVAIIKEGEIVQVEKISQLKQNNYKKFKIETVSPMSGDYFDLPGVNQLDVKGTTTSFIFRGDINTIMQKISTVQITNLWVEEPDLEEIFMHFYQREE